MKKLRSVKPLLFGLALIAAGIKGGDMAEKYKTVHETPAAVAIADSIPQAVLDRPFGAAHDTLEQRLDAELQVPLISVSAVNGIERVKAIYGAGVREGLKDYASHLGVITGAYEIYGLPGDLAIKPFIESNGRVDAISSAKARGFSQFSPEKDNNLRDYLASKGIKYEYKDWMTQLSAGAACDLFNEKAAGNSFLASQIAYNAGEGNLSRVLRDGQKAVEHRFGDIELPTIAYAFIGRSLTPEIARMTNLGTFRKESSEYMLKFAAFIPELQQAGQAGQEPIFRYVISDSTVADELSARTGLSDEQIAALNKHKLGYGTLLNSPRQLDVQGLERAHQFRDIRPEELAVTRKVLAYKSPITVPDSSLLEVAKAHNEWRRAIADEYERVALDPQTGRPSMYSLLGAWGARNCGMMTVPGERTAKYEKNKRVVGAFNSVLSRNLPEVDRMVEHFRNDGIYGTRQVP